VFRRILAGLLLLILAASQVPSIREGERGAWLALDLAGNPLPRLMGATVDKSWLGWSAHGQARQADLYRTADAKWGMVLVPGVARAGKDDPRLVAFAHALARAGWAVLVPDLPGLRELNVEPGDVDAIADAVDRGFRDYGRMDLAAISYAAGPAVLAAASPQAAGKLGTVVAVGGYSDLTQVVTFFTTGAFREAPDQPWQHREPNAYGKWAFVAGNTARLDDPADRAMVAAIAARKLADPAASVDDLARALTPQGRSLMALLDNADPDRVPQLLAALPPRIREVMAALDPARRDLSGLEAQLLLIHGRDDRIIPWTESARLAARAPQARLVLLDNLAHAELGPSRLGDAIKMWQSCTKLIHHG
jgi:pimeloyl-ACP methyl ester carboxylesterase